MSPILSLPNNMSHLPQSLFKSTWLKFCFSYSHVCYLYAVHTLGLFGCAMGEVAATGEPKMSLVFPPGGFRRCRVCTGVDSSNIPLPFPPAEKIRMVSNPEHPPHPPSTLMTSETSSHRSASPEFRPTRVE